MITRRALTFVAAGALTPPLRSFAQHSSGKLRRIGWLAPGNIGMQDDLDEYRRGMRELGYIEGQTIETEYVYADGQSERLPGLAATLVAHKVDLIVTVGTPGCLAAKAATKTIPIVFASSSDPLSTGVVDNLARPGGNITGLSSMAADLSAKRLELLQMLLPGISRIAVLWDASNPGMALRVRESQLAADRSTIAFQDAGARDLDGLEASFAELAELPPEALLVTAEAFTIRHRDRIVDFTMRNGIPTMFEEQRPVRVGGLVSYGPSNSKMFYRAATYVDKILKGARPSDLPVEQPTKFELVINLITAKRLGVTIPPTLLARADEVIE